MRQNTIYLAYGKSFLQSDTENKDNKRNEYNRSERNNKDKNQKNEKYIQPKKYLITSILRQKTPLDLEDFVLQALAYRTDPISRAKIFPTVETAMPRGVLGYYEPRRNTMTLPHDSSELIDTFFHESAHALGFTDEALTEEYGQALKRQFLYN